MRGARQLLTLRGPAPRRGLACSDLGVIRDGSLLIEDGRIDEVGSTRRIENLKKAKTARLLDVSGKVVTPGLIDVSTNLGAWPPELQDFEQRIAGLAPGMSPSGARPTHAPPAADRSERARRWLRLAASTGATTVVLRSGFGIGALQELRALRAAAKLNGDPVEVVAAFSSRPPDASAERSEESLERITDVLRRASAPVRIASSFHLDCKEERVDFELFARCLRIAGELGYSASVGADPAGSTEAARLAVEAGSNSLEGLEAVGESEIELLARSRTLATLLPNAAYHRGGFRYPPGRRLIDRGVAVALASGFRPDAQPGFGLTTAMAIACRELRLMPEEALTCSTINAAAALGESARIGSLEPNKDADLAVFDVSDYREIPYYFGVNLCWLTMKRGRIVYRAGLHAPGFAARPRGEAE